MVKTYPVVRADGRVVRVTVPGTEDAPAIDRAAVLKNLRYLARKRPGTLMGRLCAEALAGDALALSALADGIEERHSDPRNVACALILRSLTLADLEESR
jgi:hypothetical protein